MVETSCGKALYAVHKGVYVLKLVGQIRVPLCATLEGFIEQVFASEDMDSVAIDLTETEIIDSTALGLLAKIAIKFQQQEAPKPLLISTKPDVNRVLDSMGFDKIFTLVEENPSVDVPLEELPEVKCNLKQVEAAVLNAHQVLTSLNSHNKEVFKDVVSILKNGQ